MKKPIEKTNKICYNVVMTRGELEALDKAVLIEIIIKLTEKVAEQEVKLNQNSSNSSKPPSSDPPWNRPKSNRKPTGKKPGGQKGHKGHGLNRDLTPDVTVELKPEICSKCGADLSGVKGRQVATRYKIDVKVKTVITMYKIYDAKCPVCNKMNSAKLPEGLRGNVQYGEGVRAISVLLTNYAMVSYDKTSKILGDVFGVKLSPGTLVNIGKEFVEKGEPLLKEIKARLESSDLIHLDETSNRVNGKNYWVHTASNSDATYNTAHEKRGQEGTDDNGVLKNFTGKAVHDCWSTYFKYKNCLHCLCCGHLVRELTAVFENTGQHWSEDMKTLLLDMKSAVDKFKEAGKERLSRYYYKKFEQEYRRIIELGEKEAPLPPKIDGKRTKRGKARCLLDRFIKFRTEIFRFAYDFSVPFTNNMAERAIRNNKSKQKVSGGFRTETGVKNFAKTSSIIGTAIKQGLSVFKTIAGVFSGTLKSIFDSDDKKQQNDAQK